MGKRSREHALVQRMIKLYCAEQHHSGAQLCPECATLAECVAAHLARCPYAEKKPTCRRCPIHCYRPGERAAIQTVMRYAGPKMFWRGDFGALLHLWHDLWPAPKLKRDKK